ncbi:hypothetical protein DPEC_G00285220 [Dallia pectoralis]|uniref:Uncharacterized protein n=1 Tax=Dallia pectoralis TaxID=75939 RepID=A0ACC2FJH0_DALPE|nr:hypothetical protein DPEC_G00285220 [Dallia pectoralis]
MCPDAANSMFTLVILGCLGVQAVIHTDSVEYGMALTNKNDGYISRQRQYPKTSLELPRSLEMDDLKINVVPTSSKVLSAPTMVRLYLPPVKPSHIHATLPLRFGRDFQLDDTHSPKSTLNLPQRFGRSRGSGAPIPASCSECPRLGTAPSATLPQRFGRNEFYRRYQDYSYYDLDSKEEETGARTLKSSKMDLLHWSF